MIVEVMRREMMNRLVEGLRIWSTVTLNDFEEGKTEYGLDGVDDYDDNAMNIVARPVCIIHTMMMILSNRCFVIGIYSLSVDGLLTKPSGPTFGANDEAPAASPPKQRR